MAESIVVTTQPPAEGRDFAALLIRHGLPARGAGEEVEVVSRREATNLLLADLAVALRWWLDDRGLESVELSVGERRLVYDRSGRYRVAGILSLAVGA
jgi:hypothetical protein